MKEDLYKVSIFSMQGLKLQKFSNTYYTNRQTEITRTRFVVVVM